MDVVPIDGCCVFHGCETYKDLKNTFTGTVIIFFLKRKVRKTLLELGTSFQKKPTKNLPEIHSKS